MLPPLLKTASIRTLILSDQPMVLAALSQLLDLRADITLLPESSVRGREVSEQLRILQPEVVLLDGTASGAGCMAALAAINAEFPQLPVILLAAQESRTYVLQAFKAGAAGYVLSMAGEVHIVNAIHEVYAGHLYLCPRIRRLILGRLLQVPRIGNRAAK